MSGKDNKNSGGGTPKNERMTRAQLGAAVTVGAMQDALDSLFKRLDQSFQAKIDAAVTRLEGEVKAIGTDVTNLQARVSALEANANQPSVTKLAEVCNEIKERARRANNVLLFNFSELADQDDFQAVNNLLVDLGLDFEAKHVFRLGVRKPSQARARPVKVVFDSPQKVARIFRNKKSLSDKGFVVKNDETQCERDYLNNIRASLQKRIQDGEQNLTIRYVNQVPTIVSKNVSRGNTL